MVDSSCETSMYWPRPVFRRWISAARDRDQRMARIDRMIGEIRARPDHGPVPVRDQAIDAGEHIQGMADAAVIGLRPARALHRHRDIDDIGPQFGGFLVAEARALQERRARKLLTMMSQVGIRPLRDLDRVLGLEIERDAELRWNCGC